ncbi:nitronate monooxygenase [Rossellomorea marisflavi]|uniref:nitronate monooxygenase n=1 Tax=Rossellomorea marisflavi TaxID=189381 RepID=UPI00203A65A4|nr:nitronate monooxygenase [Rossellomorea marisflavi]MCM2604038.1 nitronate monooxygenase [Rossellomorea marisflavi]
MNRFLKRLSLEKPIIQAPMAGGITTTEMVKAAMDGGILGSLASGYLAPDTLEEQIRIVSAHSKRPFQVNVFVPGGEKMPKDEDVDPWKEKVPGSQHAGTFMTIEEQWDDFYRKIDLILHYKVRVCSFTFQLPPVKVVQQLKKEGCLLMGTASTVKEAVLMEERGMDMVCMQGSEAGGHRAAFLDGEGDSSIGLMTLIPQTVDAVSIPVIAAGGITDHRGLNAALALGAEAVQIGTPFLLCKESGAHPSHKRRIIESSGEETRVTSLFTGKKARGIVNDWMVNNERFEHMVLPYPHQHILTKPMRQAATQSEDPSRMSLWAGQGIGSLQRETTVKEVIDTFVELEGSV